MGNDPNAPRATPREVAPSRSIDLDAPFSGQPGEGPADKIRVLLVEDDPLFTALVTSILSEAEGDFEAVAVPRLSTALAQLVRDGVDLILADLNLPDSQGPATVGFLRRAAPGIPLIVLSGTDDVQVALEAIRQGADEYVVKGRFSVDSLVWLVRLVVERHRRTVANRSQDAEMNGGLENLAAFQVVGRHLIRVAERTNVHLGVIVLVVQAAPRGEWADWERLLVWVSHLLERTLRRCDVLSRTGPTELAAVLVSPAPLDGAVERLRQSISAGGAAAHVRIGFAAHDPANPTNLDALLAEARNDAQPASAMDCR